MKKSYAKSNIRELFLAILPAQIFSFVTSSLSGIANGILIGVYLSSIDMIALGFASPIVQIIGVFSTVISAGARVLCGRYMGRGERDKINEAFTVAIKLLLLIGVVLTVFCFFGSKLIASIIASQDALINTSSYLKGIAIGLIPTILVPCLMVFLQMENHGTYSLIATILLAVFNISIGVVALELLNIGIFGVGLVTSISQYLILAFILIKYFKDKKLPRIVKCDYSIAKNIIVIGLPTALASLLYAIRNSVLNSYTSSIYGNAAVNALSIMTSSCGPLDAVNIGTGQTAMMLAAVYIGEKDEEALKTLARVMIKIGVILAFIKVALIAGFGRNIAILFGGVGEVIDLTWDLYFAYSLAAPLNMIALYFINVYQAFGKIKYCNIIIVFTAIIFPLSFAFLGKPLIGINSIWYCYAFAEIAILIFIWLGASIKKKHIIKNFNELITLDSQLEVGNHITISVTNIDEVVTVAKDVQEYCLSENVDPKKSMMAGLCCEEIAANIVEHGFTKSKKKKKEIDIYVDADKEDVNIRIKDNAVAFDPHIKLNENDDPTVNIGIKMVSKLAKEMNYQNNFGLNVLSIKI